MTLPGNGTTKKILVGVLTAISIMLMSQVIINSSRLTAVETRQDALKEMIIQTRVELLRQVEVNRVENRDEHKTIVDKLDQMIGREVTKK